ncbi:site-specific recombinase XerC [Halohasta litchfieldiae]|jgi:integrase|uniref:Site-specific recombinase XerC n=1 Tax=Halohasta litchfieldiae TaxID=1073996 RepID=A0A1H6VU81_9EURY|nr:tyrosine-type recombinase/integrase [Halohasta litchfieldiae]ATW87227.1 site-specific recombinase XerC [Halohasta litchfieldiae]SEJ08211.1 Site-specific recombinase XerC [Halohasta litchfieldiae]
MKLEPIAPETALEMYLTDRENEVAQATLYSHRSRLSHFVRWCDENEVGNLNQLTGRMLHQYRLWRRDEGDIGVVTEKTQMDTLRVFIRWLESIDAVEPDLHTKVLSPTLSSGDNVRTEMLETERAEQILSYFGKYEYASRPHIVVSLMWHTMMRVGAIHSLDLEDYNSDGQYLEVVHRPETKTPIKNAEGGERHVALSESISELLDSWISDRRPSITDEKGRQPLESTSQGRAHITTLRGDCYRSTRPCEYTGECPHDRSISDCDAAEYGSESECPSSVSPHALRRGGISHHLNCDVPKDIVSDRANVSKDVLDTHYDKRSEQDKMEQRRKYLNNI